MHVICATPPPPPLGGGDAYAIGSTGCTPTPEGGPCTTEAARFNTHRRGSDTPGGSWPPDWASQLCALGRSYMIGS